jgi:hypothetical protein
MNESPNARSKKKDQTLSSMVEARLSKKRSSPSKNKINLIECEDEDRVSENKSMFLN